MKKLWFKNKTYGWGWTPASWEGWAVILGWVGVFALGEITYLNALKSYEGAARVTIIFMAWTALIVGGLIYVCVRTGEKPEWRWGNKPKPPQPPELDKK